jgi:hypothetical protein
MEFIMFTMSISQIVSGFSGVTNYDIIIKVGKAKFRFTPEFIMNHKGSFVFVKPLDVVTDYDISTNTTTYIFTCEDTKSMHNMLKRLVK